MTATKTEPVFDKGLGNTIAAESEMSYIDGANGILEYVGIEIDALARKSTFEEVVFLLWNRRLPTAAELDAFSSSIRAAYELPGGIIDVIQSLPKGAAPMHALRTVVSALALYDEDPDDNSLEGAQRKSISLLAKTPAIIAAYDRHRKGKPIVPPSPDASIAESFLTMLTGTKPTETMARALDVCLILHADHGLNASTFAARVTIATLSDMYSAMATAIGTLKGPLHGGANEAVMHLLHEIGDLEKVESAILGKLERKERVMGFGHRVYKAYDPRATYLKTFAKQLAEDTGNMDLYEMSHRIEQIMDKAVGSKGIYPNVEFYSATTYFSVGLDIDLFTPMFAMSRISGWAGHCIEQLADNRLIRPRIRYVGPHDVAYAPINER
ncbi:MAG: citrate/2-methylcitrate synthase [Planctomycetota bacterium]